MDKVLDKNAENMYQEKFLLSVRISTTNDGVFIKARCAAEMRKNLSYNTDVVLDSNGIILECQCDCGDEPVKNF